MGDLIDLCGYDCTGRSIFLPPQLEHFIFLVGGMVVIINHRGLSGLPLYGRVGVGVELPIYKLIGGSIGFESSTF